LAASDWKRAGSQFTLFLHFFHMQDDSTILDNEGFGAPQLGRRTRRSHSGLRRDRSRYAQGAQGLKTDDPFRLWVTDKASGRGDTLFRVKVAAENG
jgi:hypothetical protein